MLAMNQTANHQTTPYWGARSAEDAAITIPHRMRGVRRRPNPSAHMAIAGAVITLASIGAERIKPISVPLMPRW